MELEDAAALTVDDSDVAVVAEHQDVLTAGVFTAANHPPFGAEPFRADHPLACHQIQRADINPACGEHDRRSMFKSGLVPGMDHLLVRGFTIRGDREMSVAGEATDRDRGPDPRRATTRWASRFVPRTVWLTCVGCTSASRPEKTRTPPPRRIP